MPSDKPRPTDRPPSRRPAPPPKKPDWTDREKAWLKFGVSLAVLGCIGVIAPVFGLQFRKVKDANAQVPVSIGLIILGGVIDLIVLFRHGGLGSVNIPEQTKRWILYGLSGAVLLTVLACGGLVIAAKIREGNHFAAPERPTGPGGPVAPGAPANVGRPPAGKMGPPVRITLKNIKNLDLAPIRAKLEALSSRPEFPVGMPPFIGSDEFPVSLFYSDSLESLVAKIDFGKAEITNANTRHITVTVDRSQFSERKTR